MRGESKTWNNRHWGTWRTLQGPGLPGRCNLNSLGPPEHRLLKSILWKDKLGRLEATND